MPFTEPITVARAGWLELPEGGARSMQTFRIESSGGAGSPKEIKLKEGQVEKPVRALPQVHK